ncbi:hypothetical protein MCZ49_16040 [Bacillus safensis]|uniref:hypothetical protein n=1 Tax=Bacillus TaxID=1386 RepID=UPI0022814140|nr:hypothetical protein [Bacillus safensis]MCY7433231.1 hypothetical protein [Bacillus safensis]MDH3109794.1 hypothetical protein [Bacillus altitudinis]MED0867124.1 hypothetical protein [Bacillus safensis]
MTLLEQIDNHSLFNDLPELKVEVESLLNDEEFIAELDKEGTELVNRVKLVIDYTDNSINSSDSMLLRESHLNNMRAHINNIKVWLGNRNFLDSQNNRIQLNDALNKILDYSIYIPLTTRDNIDSIREAATGFRRSIGMQKSHFEKEVRELEGFSEDVQNDLTNLYEKVETFSTKFEEKISNMESRQDELHSGFLQKEADRMAAFEEQKSKFRESIDESLYKWNENIKIELDERKNEFNQFMNDLKDEQDHFIEATKTKLSDYDEILSEHQIAVEEVLGLISTNSISAHHKEVANKAEKSKKIWQTVTVVAFATTVLFSVFALFFNKITDLSWPNLVAKILVIGSLGSLTAYTARQAKVNQELEFKNRQLEVELKTLNPYIASFDNEEQENLKKALFPKIFGREEKLESLNQKDDGNSIEELIRQLIPLLEKSK